MTSSVTLNSLNSQSAMFLYKYIIIFTYTHIHILSGVPEQVFSGDEKSQVVGQPFLHESQAQPCSGSA